MNGHAFLARARRAARIAFRSLVEWKGAHRAAWRRGRAGRPARRPRVPRELQVPVAHRRERVAAPPLRPPARGRPRPTRRRLVRRGRAGRARRALRDGARRRRRLAARPMRATSTARNGARSAHRFATDGRRRARPSSTRRSSSGSPTESARRWRARDAAPTRRARCCGDCCASAARRTSCSARRRPGSCACASRHRGTGGAHFELRAFDVEPRAGGQPMVGWHAVVRDRCRHATKLVVHGHVEVRWSHGRFAAPPEAKVYLDTPHARGPRLLPAHLTHESHGSGASA